MSALNTNWSELLFARAFKGLLLDADIADREEKGELPRARDPRTQSALLGKYEEFFSGTSR